MKNRAIIIITVLFSFMLVGIVLIQQGLVSRVEKLNREAFDAAVYRSLNGVVKQVEEKENFSFIKREVSGDTIIHSAKNLKLIKPSSSKTPLHASISNSVKIRVDHDSDHNTRTVIRIEKDKNGTRTIENSVTITSGEQIELPEVPPVPPLPPIKNIPEEKIEDIEVLVKKMSHIKDPDSITIKPSDIKKIIAGQLKQNDLPDTFSFCLLTKDQKSYCGETPAGNDEWRPYKINLYPNDLFGREVTLVLMFKVRDTLARSGVSWVFSLSVFFTLATLALFIYSIRMLLRHKKMLELKNDFINHMSHEFKTPLAGISLGADMLLDKPEKLWTEQINKIALIIKKQSAMLNDEVNEVLLSAQLEENIVRSPAPFDLVHTTKTQVEMFELQLQDKKGKVLTHFNPETIVVTGDEALWQKVFSNLLDNSLKFSKEDPEIFISITKVSNSVRIEFSDNGIGIAQKDLTNIFEKFFRSNYYKRSNIQGFGLGLNFVKKVIDSHKGKIRAESELGKGTKIIIEINA